MTEGVDRDSKVVTAVLPFPAEKHRDPAAHVRHILQVGFFAGVGLRARRYSH